ncbi:hypothetical protein [Saprospira grandis]|uniref:hypothetical protein n=1 Tax=Saprospira grandis TaxID=1008 RepID=UPI001C10B8BD|nr:hypothetical protein [Saprospira grandis]
MQYKSLSELLAQLSPEDPEYQSFKAALTKAKKVLGPYKKQLAKEKIALETIIASFLGAQQEDIPKDKFWKLFQAYCGDMQKACKKAKTNVRGAATWKTSSPQSDLSGIHNLFTYKKKKSIIKELEDELYATVQAADKKSPIAFLEELEAIFANYEKKAASKDGRSDHKQIETSLDFKNYVLSPNQLESILDQALAKDDFLTEEEKAKEIEDTQKEVRALKEKLLLKIQEEKNSINRWKDEEYLTWDDSISLTDCLAPSYFPQVVANDYYTDKYVKVATVKNSLLQSLERLEEEGSLEEHKVFIHCGFDFSNYRVQSLREIFEAVEAKRLKQLDLLPYLGEEPRGTKVDMQLLQSLLSGMNADPNDFLGQLLLTHIKNLKSESLSLSELNAELAESLINNPALLAMIPKEFPKESAEAWLSFDAQFKRAVVPGAFGTHNHPLQKIIQAWSEEYRDLFSNKLAKYKYRYFSRKTLERNAQNNLKISDFPELETLFQQTFKETLVEGEKLSYSEVASSWQAFLLELVIHKGLNNLEPHQAAVQALEKAGIHALADSTKLEAIFQPIPLPKKETETLFDLGKNSFKIQWIFNWKKAVADIVLLAEKAEEIFNTIEDNITDIIAEGVKRITDWILQIIPDMSGWWSDDDTKKARKTTTDRKSVIRLLKAKLIEALKTVAAKEQDPDSIEYTFSLSRKTTEGGSFSYAITNNSSPIVTKGGNNYMTIKASDLFTEYSKSEKTLKIKFLLRVEKNSFQTTNDVAMSAFTVVTAGTSGSRQVSNAYTEQYIEITAKIKESTKEEITVEVNTSKDNFNCVNMAEVAFATSVDITPPSQTKTIKLTPVAK